MVENIPLELQALAQWVCAGPDKKPLNPRTGASASPTDKSTWATFVEAVQAGYKHIGFVLTKEDPYTIIDLDDPVDNNQIKRHAKIVESFNSYTEVSQSQKGVHIIIKGKLPQGRRRDKVEIYSESRYMICTGNVINQYPICDSQKLLDVLYREMPATIEGDLTQVQGNFSDEEILEMACNAANADKFNQLCSGDWENDYESQSEADFALLSIFAFYTEDNDQTRRLFRMSALGKREKAVKNNTYLNFALKKIRAKQPPPIDMVNLEAFTANLLERVEEPIVVNEAPATVDHIPFPPGLIGEMGTYIFDSAILPVHEVALASALTLAAGIVGQRYNVSATGLNQYIIVLAKTGMGKEGGAKGINALINACRPSVPLANDFIGPGSFASGQALIRILDTKSCFVSIIGEFGLTLQQLCDPRAAPADKALKRVLLDLYGKSGPGDILSPTVYSDSEKNTNMIHSPCVTIFGESTPSTFYEGLDLSHIAEGLIPRFSILEYTGKRARENKNAFFPPSNELVFKLGEMMNTALAMAQNNMHAPVNINSEAEILLDTLSEYSRTQINSEDEDIVAQLWNRAHLKTLKLAALVAVGVNVQAPVINKEIAQWAIDFVSKEIAGVLNRFKKGDVGQGESKQEVVARLAIKKYLGMDKKTRRKHKVSEKLVDESIIPYSFISAFSRQRACFKNDRKGANAAVQAILDHMVQTDVLAAIPKQQGRAEYGATAQLYVLGSNW